MTSTNTTAISRFRLAAGATGLVCAAWVGPWSAAQAQTALANAPIFATQAVPGNVALPLSVEYPTVQRVAHTDAYSTAAAFLGYFDPDKCYTYTYAAADTAARPPSAAVVSYFQPAGAATGHVCTGTWSGNFLNWATTHTIDPFRWALTGGFRVVDTTTLTVLEKAWSTGQGGLFPNKTIPAALVPGATPFTGTAINIRIDGLGNKMRFTGSGNLGVANATAYNPAVAFAAGTTYEVFARARVCDSSVAAGGVETNCVQYGANWKPEGLMQKYSQRMRFSVFGYLNQDGTGRDGGVLRARQKFVGPTTPVPGSAALANAAAEWDPTTGVFAVNPDPADATATNAEFGVPVTNSGVINYLNKFGETSPAAGYTFKSNDPVSELYYAAVRYFKNLGNVPEYTSMTGATLAERTKWVDGFPVITNWTDPIQYSCQRNFILGIGDIYTHADKNLPGAGTGATLEPAKPALVANDTSVSAVTATNKAFALQGLAAPNWNNYSGRNNSAGIVGLAYDSHTRDIRPNLAGVQTIDTYWVDVLEAAFEANNQFYLAAKFGGFTVPVGYDTYGNTTALPAAWWHTPNGTVDTNTVGGQLRPDNYYTGGRPDLMIAGLNAAFSRIASQLTAYTTSFSTAAPQVAQTNNASYSSLYDASSWTGEVRASSLSFDTTNNTTTLLPAWAFTDRLAIQLGGTGWLNNRRVVTWNGTTGVQFCSGTAGCGTGVGGAQLAALDPDYVAGNDSADYINYLRGDRTNEQGTGGTRAYRTRTKLLGDIVGSKVKPVGPPNALFSDTANPGYSAFKAAWANRPTVAYVGANDGMLHAIHGGLTPAVGGGGTELFAYVPAALFQGPNATPNVDGLASLGNPSFQHHFMVDSTPNVYDVDFSRTQGSSGAPNWRSILIGGLGKGGRSFYAIDVTDPMGMYNGGEAAVASKVLWEFTDPDLGYTYGEPIVNKTQKYGWVVIIPSGYNNANGAGHLLILNPRTGALLEKVSTGVGTPANSAGLAHLNTFVQDGSDFTADAVYAGDLLGNLWRWDLTGMGPYPAPLRMAILADANGTPQPVTSRAKIEIHPTLKKRFVLIGTGRLLDQSDIASTQEQTFYAISDGINARFNAAADLPAGINFPITRAALVANTNAVAGVSFGTVAGFDPVTKMGWYEDLGRSGTGIGWRVTNTPTTLLGSVAWATTLPNGDVCNPSGESRVYARDFATAKTTLRDANGAAMGYVPVAGYVTDLRYFSVGGKRSLIAGNDVGATIPLREDPTTGLTLRRLNWRELQIVD